MMIAGIFGMLMTSCQNDLDLAQNAGEAAVVTFSVGTPEIATRSFSDGQTATVLQYAVYDAEGNELEDLTVTDAEIHGSTTVNLQLTTGNTYSVIFWAAAENAPYTVDFSAKKMTVDYTNAVSNDENRDAFYKYHTFTVSGAQTETIELKRPFAQLNVGTNDFTASEKAGYAPAYSYVKVPVSTVLNLVDGTVDQAAEVEFALAEIPAGETFPVSGYEYISMNYLLVAADKEVVDVTFGYSENDQTVEKTRTVGSVPVQRNHRTNIYGQLLTSDVDINVEIEPDYDEPSYAADALNLAAAIGGEVTLTEDVVLSEPLKIQNNVVINLNGKTLSAASEKGDGAVVEVAQGVFAKVTGGVIKSTTDNGDAAINNAGELVLENVEVVGAPLADGGYSAYAVISSGKLTINDGFAVSADRGCLKLSGAGETVINGGLFTNNDIGSRTLTSHVVDVEDGGSHKLTINGGTFQHLHSATSGGVVVCNRTTGTVYVNGGDFSGGNYYGNDNLSDYGYGGTFVVKGGTYTAAPAASYIASGYKVLENNGKYHVVEDVIDAIVSNKTELKDAVTNGDDVISISSEIDLADVVLSGYNGTIVGSEGAAISTRNFTPSADEAYQLRGTNLTFKNIDVKLPTGGDWLKSGFVGTGEIVFDNCNFEGQATLNGSATWTFNDCTFVSTESGKYASFVYGATKATFNRCSFSGVDRAAKVYGTGGTLDVEYNTCTFTSSTLNKAGVEIDASYATTAVVLNACSQTDMAGLYALEGTKGTVTVK